MGCFWVGSLFVGLDPLLVRRRPRRPVETHLLAIEGDVRAMREFEAEVRRELDAES